MGPVTHARSCWVRYRSGSVKLVQLRVRPQEPCKVVVVVGVVDGHGAVGAPAGGVTGKAPQRTPTAAGGTGPWSRVRDLVHLVACDGHDFAPEALDERCWQVHRRIAGPVDLERAKTRVGTQYPFALEPWLAFLFFVASVVEQHLRETWYRGSTTPNLNKSSSRKRQE